MATTLVTLHQMIDMALATPEIGVINVAVLNSLLHLMVKQIQVSTERTQNTEKNENQEIVGSNQQHHTFDKEIPANHQQNSATHKEMGSYTENQVQHTKDLAQHDNNKPPLPKKKKNISILVPAKGSTEDLLTTEHNDEGNQYLTNTNTDIDLTEEFIAAERFLSTDSLYSQERFETDHILNTRMKSLNIILQEVIRKSTDYALLNRRRGKQSENPLAELWHMINVGKRVDGAEKNLRKLAAILQGVSDKLRNSPFSEENAAALTQTLDNLQAVTTELEQKQNHLKAMLDDLKYDLTERQNKLESLLMQTLKELEDKLDRIVFVKTMSEVQDMMDAKVDKLCIPPLKQYITDKLIGFQGTLDYFANEFGLVPDAAGARARHLYKLDCISCGQAVYQKDIEVPPFVPKLDGAHPSNVIKSDDATPMDKEDGRLRYCGGSHTITMAEERSITKGHFVEQFGGVGKNLTCHCPGRT